MTADRGNPETEEALMEAADRLLDEQVRALAALPALTVIAVAETAGVSRATAHRYPEFLKHLDDLKKRSPLVTAADLSQLKSAHRSETDQLRKWNEILANRVQALTLEVERLRHQRTDVVPIDRNRAGEK